MSEEEQNIDEYSSKREVMIQGRFCEEKLHQKEETSRPAVHYVFPAPSQGQFFNT